jgi:hypothetical protein
MSWLRWLTLYSFRVLNPDWAICLYGPEEPCGPKAWATPEDDDSEYAGGDYSDRLESLRVERRTWANPLPHLGRAQACDLFQWELLAGPGGFYCDADILWLKPLEPIRRSVADADAVFCLESGAMAIGFMASNRQPELFWDLYKAVLAAGVEQQGAYQGYGTDAVYGFALPDGPGPLTEAGHRVIAALRERYPKERLAVVPDETVYPFDWRQIDAIFTEDLEVPEATVGIHWFGGAPIAREWNCRLTESNWHLYSNTLTRCLRTLLQ